MPTPPPNFSSPFASHQHHPSIPEVAVSLPYCRICHPHHFPHLHVHHLPHHRHGTRTTQRHAHNTTVVLPPSPGQHNTRPQGGGSPRARGGKGVPRQYHDTTTKAQVCGVFRERGGGRGGGVARAGCSDADDAGGGWRANPRRKRRRRRRPLRRRCWE